MKAFEELTVNELREIYKEYCEMKTAKKTRAPKMAHPNDDGHTMEKRAFEKYAEGYLLEHGFTYHYTNQSATRFSMDITKDGYTENIKAYALADDQKGYMQQLVHQWELSKLMYEAELEAAK